MAVLDPFVLNSAWFTTHLCSTQIHSKASQSARGWSRRYPGLSLSPQSTSSSRTLRHPWMLSYWWEHCFIILGGRCLPGRKSLWPAEKNGIHIASDPWESSIACLQQLPFLKCGSPMLMCVACAAATSGHDSAHSPCCWQVDGAMVCVTTKGQVTDHGLCSHLRPCWCLWSVLLLRALRESQWSVL